MVENVAALRRLLIRKINLHSRLRRNKEIVMAENIAEEMAQSEAYDSEQRNPACFFKKK